MPPRTRESTSSVKKGDKIQAKWSGSNIYYDATVLETGTKLCKVLFEDGSIHSVKPSDIKAAAKARSTSRTRSTRGRSRSTSAGRKALPSRSRSRSPARKSVATKVEKKTPSKPERASNSLLDKQVDKEVTITLMKNYSSSVSTETSNDKRVFTKKEVHSERQERDTKSLSDKEETSDKDFLKNVGTSLRTSARIAAVQMAKSKAQEMESVPKTNAIPKSSKSFSDDESEEEEDEIDGQKRAVEHKWFWILRSIGVFLQILLMPAIVVGLYSACPKKLCTVLEVPRFPQRLSAYLDPKSSLVYVSFALLQAILFIIPIGKEVAGFPFGRKSTVLKYRLNGFISVLVNIILLCALGYFDVSLNFGCDKFFPLMITSIIFSFILAILMHIKSRWALPHLRNPKGDTGSVLSDFFFGREINPRIGQKFDVKLYALRFGVTAWAMLLICCLYKSYFTRNYLDISLILVASMQMFYILDTTFREDVILSTATFTSDGMGYQLICGAFTVIPFLNTIQPLYLVNHGSKATTMPYWCSAAIVALFFCGYYIFLQSNNTKHAFRRNPYCPTLAHVESIPTSKKKRLIVSGWWGIVRHPNYLGDLIMCIAWTLPCGFNHFIPFCPLILTIFLFVVRSLQIDAECKEKYGPAWQCYTEKVRSRIIPYIF